jgi:hypothetical protein
LDYSVLFRYGSENNLHYITNNDLTSEKAENEVNKSNETEEQIQVEKEDGK